MLFSNIFWKSFTSSGIKLAGGVSCGAIPKLGNVTDRVDFPVILEVSTVNPQMVVEVVYLYFEL
jgi:hypothetical protein